jgi:hypothetical protein
MKSLGMSKNSCYFALLLSVLFLLPISCGSEREKQVSREVNDVSAESGDKMPEIKFIKTVHDFGKIYQGEVVGANFSFTNTGNSNLMILDASASCGCTVPKWSKETIPPGGKGSLEVIFDSSGREGMQNKSISVSTNASNENSILYITAEVLTE